MRHASAVDSPREALALGAALDHLLLWDFPFQDASHGRGNLENASVTEQGRANIDEFTVGDSEEDRSMDETNASYDETMESSFGGNTEGEGLDPSNTFETNEDGCDDRDDYSYAEITDRGIVDSDDSVGSREAEENERSVGTDETTVDGSVSSVVEEFHPFEIAVFNTFPSQANLTDSEDESTDSDAESKATFIYDSLALESKRFKGDKSEDVGGGEDDSSTIATWTKRLRSKKLHKLLTKGRTKPDFRTPSATFQGETRDAAGGSGRPGGEERENSLPVEKPQVYSIQKPPSKTVKIGRKWFSWGLSTKTEGGNLPQIPELSEISQDAANTTTAKEARSVDLKASKHKSTESKIEANTQRDFGSKYANVDTVPVREKQELLRGAKVDEKRRPEKRLSTKDSRIREPRMNHLKSILFEIAETTKEVMKTNPRIVAKHSNRTRTNLPEKLSDKRNRHESMEIKANKPRTVTIEIKGTSSPLPPSTTRDLVGTLIEETHDVEPNKFNNDSGGFEIHAFNLRRFEM